MTTNSDDRHTPVDSHSTLELLFEKLDNLEITAQRSLDICLRMYEEHKGVVARVAVLEKTLWQRIWFPAAISVLAATAAVLSRVWP